MAFFLSIVTWVAIARSWLRDARRVGAVVLLLGAAGPVLAQCPSDYHFNPGNWDYHDPARQSQIRTIEGNHMNDNVRGLIRGQSTASVGGDLRFVIQIVPNHPDALNLLVRLALRDRTERPPETEPLSVECWLHRATVFRPDDAMPHLIYGIYLGRLGKVDGSIEQLLKADEMLPNDANIAYNLGLMYVEKKDYERAMEYAKRAYDGGFPLPGLKQKLMKAGRWRD